MLLYIEDRSDGPPPFCLQTVMKKQGTCQVYQQVLLQYFWFLFLWQDSVKICSSLTWSHIQCVCCCCLLLTIDQILKPFSLAADFVRFLVCFGPIRTDIFVCAVILVRYITLGHPCQRGRIAT